MSSWFVYMLRCEDGSLYTGITTDIDRRLEEHKNGTASKYTAAFGAEEIVYTEPKERKEAALKREHEIKQLPRTQKEALITE